MDDSPRQFHSAFSRGTSMIDLNDAAAIRAADPFNFRDHLVALPNQLEDGWAAAQAIHLPESFGQIDRVVLVGMGGSAIGGSLFASLAAPECPHPIRVVRDYDLPAYASRSNTLVIALSFSGNTEEVLAAFEQAYARGCQLLVVTGGGQLAERAQAVGAPVIRIQYSSLRHSALGWVLAPLLNLASRLSWTHDFAADLDEATKVLREWTPDLDVDVPVMKNLAKREAGQLLGRSVILFGAGHFAEVARRWKEQINESAKAWAAIETLPDANHNSLAGLEWPDEFTSKVMVLFLTGQSDHPRNTRRIQLTRQAYMLAGCNTDFVVARGKGSLAQMMSLVLLGDFIGYYLALLYGAEPTRVPVVAEFKAALGD
jgi:glucose/mannose-6-phosphate isomerase